MLRFPNRSLVTLVLLSGLFSGCGRDDSPIPEDQPTMIGEPGVVRLDQATIDSLGIEVVVVSSAAGTFELSLPGEVLPAPENFAIVSAPTGGRVAEIAAHEGEYVRRGQVLLNLESAEFAGMVA